jgi:murein DD-endopeptidase MepM/ murein hydrolase activator NlpD
MANHPDEPFKLASPLQMVGRFVERHLTPIAIGVAAIGVALAAFGPARALLSGREGAGGEQGPLFAADDPMTLSTGEEVIFASNLRREFEPYTIIPDRPRDEVVVYTVQPGDTLTTIALAFNLDRTTIFWSNADTLQGDVHMLTPGMDLYIMPVDGVYHKADGSHTLQWIADEYEVDVESIITSEYNELADYTPADTPPWGMRIVVPGGVGQFADWRPPVQETVDAETGVVTRSFMPGMAGSCAAGIVGSGGTGAWARPIQGAYSFTQPFYPGHSGVDLGAPVGTPVTAADAGVVIFSGWVDASWGYGVLVVLDHGNGYTTYYAHLSAAGVGCGQYVARGGYVGQVGSTGNSSGAHLHFEIRWNHVPDNPASYLGF